MSFSSPYALILLAAIPFVIWLGWPRGNWSIVRRRIAVILRVLIITLLVLALSGMQMIRSADSLAVVFLIDASDSMPDASVEAARQFAEDAITSMRAQDQAAIIVFGSDAVVERPMTGAQSVGPLESEVVSLNTDLAEAIRLGMALYPPGSARRMVILSDGIVNVGDAAGAARLAAASGVQVVAAPIPAASGAEVLVSSVSVPTRLNEGQTFDLTVTVESNLDTEAALRIMGGGQVVLEERVALQNGVNRYSFTLSASAPGLTSFTAQVIPDEGDLFYQNNELAAFTQVVGPPRILIVSDDPEESTNLANALLTQGLEVDAVTGGGFPRDVATLSQYQSIVLTNVPASSLGPRAMELIQVYVRDLGGGLVMSGGPNSFAPGGYFQTPIEETLPIDMQLKDEERLPQLTVVYVIDRSGSMSDTSVGGIPKIELAKEAILRSVDLLGPRDRVGVVSFDESATWLVDLGPATDRQTIGQQVAALRAGGGTDIYAGVLAVSRVLPGDPATLRHIVLLTDGGASEAGIPELVAQMYDEHGITLSVIAIGQGYAPFIEELPELADGRFHYAYNVETIPEIFTEETVIATRAYVIEGEFFPALTSTHPIMTGIEGTPSLLGYIGSTIKPTAQNILVTNNDDPLLAAWQYGLGRSVAWTSDATGRWGSNWVSWDEYARFWSQAVRWTITEGATQNVEVRVMQEGDTSRIIVDAIDEDGNFINGLDLDASVVQPDVSATAISLVQVAPGRYETTFTPETEGAYFVRVAGADAAGTSIAQTSGWVLAYSPEYRSFAGDPEYLAYITGLTGGSLIDRPTSAVAANLNVERARLPIWPWLLLAAAALLPFDIGFRRLVITRRDLQRLAAALGLTPRPVAEAEPRTSRAGALFAARERAAERYEQPANTPTTEVELPPPSATPAPPPAAKPAPSPQPQPSGRSTASTLLQRKRQREEEDT